MYRTSNPLLSGNIHGDKKIWFVGGIFSLAGLIILLIPLLTTFFLPPNSPEAIEFANASFLLYCLGAYFALLGALTIFLKIRNTPNLNTEVVIGAIAALTYALGALVMPIVLYISFLTRPNFFYTADLTEFPAEDFWIGLIFFSTGLITLIAVILLVRHFIKTGSNSVSLKF
ncbi:MAG: hypothetical protein ACRCZE_01575 [Candidatus Altimarinota bacterium]